MRNCCVIGCKSSDARIIAWQKGYCDLHDSQNGVYPCTCWPYRLHNYPKNILSNKDNRKEWIKRINREDFEPTKDSRVCSLHFMEGEPTEKWPYPILNMGYNLSTSLMLPKRPGRYKRKNIGINQTKQKQKKTEEETERYEKHTQIKEQLTKTILDFIKAKFPFKYDLKVEATVKVKWDTHENRRNEEMFPDLEVYLYRDLVLNGSDRSRLSTFFPGLTACIEDLKHFKECPQTIENMQIKEEEGTFVVAMDDNAVSATAYQATELEPSPNDQAPGPFDPAPGLINPAPGPLNPAPCPDDQTPGPNGFYIKEESNATEEESSFAVSDCWSSNICREPSKDVSDNHNSTSSPMEEFYPAASTLDGTPLPLQSQSNPDNTELYICHNRFANTAVTSQIDPQPVAISYKVPSKSKKNVNKQLKKPTSISKKIQVEKDHICNQCYKYFLDGECLRNHISRKHGGKISTQKNQASSSKGILDTSNSETNVRENKGENIESPTTSAIVIANDKNKGSASEQENPTDSEEK